VEATEERQMADKKRKKKKGAERTFADMAAIPMAVSGAGAVLIGLIAWSIQGKFGWVAILFCVVGLVLIGAGVALKPKEVKELIRSRQMMMGTSTSVSILAVLGILIFVNYIAIRHHHRFDWTKMKQHTLSEQTRKVLKGLKKDISITAFYSPESGRDMAQMEDLLREYKEHSRKVKTEVVNALLQPDKAQMMQVDRLGTTIVECGEEREQVTSANEQSLTSAILKVSDPTERKVYFLSGHGEHDINDMDQQKGYTDAKKALEELNYKVDALSLLQKQPTIPEDCTVLVIAGPKKPLIKEESSLINDYLSGQGRLLAMVDPESPALSEILAPWEVEALPGVVIELSQNYFFSVGMPVVNQYEPHLITNPMRNLATVFPLVRPIKAESTPPPSGEPGYPPPSANQASPLLRTTSDSWVESDISSGKVSYDEGKDEKGPFSIAAAVASGSPPPPQYPGAPPPPPDDSPKTRLVVVGDSDFAANEWLKAFANRDLFTNMVNWLAEREDLVSIQPKEPYVTTVDLTKSQVKLVFFFTVVIVPVLVLLTGGIVWWKRR